jgi:hypothetical protein
VGAETHAAILAVVVPLAAAVVAYLAGDRGGRLVCALAAPGIAVSLCASTGAVASLGPLRYSIGGWGALRESGVHHSLTERPSGAWRQAGMADARCHSQPRDTSSVTTFLDHPVVDLRLRGLLVRQRAQDEVADAEEARPPEAAGGGGREHDQAAERNDGQDVRPCAEDTAPHPGDAGAGGVPAPRRGAQAAASPAAAAARLR